MRLSLRRTVEGKTTLLVPAESLASRAPPTYPVFFNKAARLNRDVSVAFAAVVKPRSVLDSLTGTGARGVRVLNESGAAPMAVTLLDFNRRSLAVAAKNVRLNGLSATCSVVHSEANAYFYSRFERAEKYDAVDVDPFGTPAPYLLGALGACGDRATLSFTATDAAVLCGVYPVVALRRYGSSVPRSEFVHETALRVLAGFAARMGAINDIGITPVAAHSTLHYFRVYARVRRGARAADESMGKIGYVTQCNGCFSRYSETSPSSRCSECGTRVRPAGPLWTGPLCDATLSADVAKFCSREGWIDSAATVASTVGVDEFPPFSYSLERCASRMKVPSVRVEDVLERLRSSGSGCMIQPFDELSIKTTAGYREFEAAVKDASARSESS